jgi:predicted dehydrogenase/threonine dehydrogenase-like Zn-dependent dehydrogenase
MKQILQHFRTGQISVSTVPAPMCSSGTLLIVTRQSLISSGTERMLVEFGQANLLQKARSQPAKVRQVLDKVRTDGFMPTLDAVRNKLDQPLSLGYCNVGVIVEIGTGVDGFAVGDRVISNGSHAEVVCVPENLCARIPDDVTDEEATFTVPGAIALQGIRLLNPTLGERIAVFGLGLLGLLTVQILRANGCQVLGFDFNKDRLALACQLGAQVVDLSAGEDSVAAGLAFSCGQGMDGVLITASSRSNEVIHQAAQMSRKRGRIVLVGVVGLHLDRADFYEKELSFQVSCSYGPGRYDPEYEEKGQDYPFGLVRWTEQRNFEAMIQLMADGKLDAEPLITHRVPQAQAEEAYRLLTEDPNALGILLTYPEAHPKLDHTIKVLNRKSDQTRAPTSGRHSLHTDLRLGVIGAGNFATGVLLPAVEKTPAKLQVIASTSGTSAAVAARKFGFEEATSDYHSLIENPQINAVVIATRHNTHARLAIEALQAGKHVFVEKPLALNQGELVAVRQALNQAPGLHLMVGFNRRFAPLALHMKALLERRIQPLNLLYTINAGTIPASHWTQNPEVGGGRIIGEGCHFVDFLRFIVGHPITGIEARMMGVAPSVEMREDKMSILLEFADGSLGTIHYLANGSKKYPKERIEAFGDGRVLVLENYRELRAYGWPKLKRKRLWRQDKGHTAEIAAFVERVSSGGKPLIAWTELEEVAQATFAAVARARESTNGGLDSKDPPVSLYT